MFVITLTAELCCCCCYFYCCVWYFVFVSLTVDATLNVVVFLSFVSVAVVLLLWCLSDCCCVVLLQPAGEGGAGDMAGDRDLLRHLSDQADGATAGLQVGETYGTSYWWVTHPAGPLNEPKPSIHHSVNAAKKNIKYVNQHPDQTPSSTSSQGLHERRRDGEQEDRLHRQPAGQLPAT